MRSTRMPTSIVMLCVATLAVTGVASAAGGIPDKVRPGQNGWLVAPGDASSLAAAISGAVGDLPRLAHYGLAGRRIVEQEFSWGAAGDATVALYRELLG